MVAPKDSDYGNHKGRLKIKGGNILGSGSNDKVRSWVAKRPLGEVAIPKVITMNGSLGWGWLDHICQIHVGGGHEQMA